MNFVLKKFKNYAEVCRRRISAVGVRVWPLATVNLSSWAHLVFAAGCRLRMATPTVSAYADGLRLSAEGLVGRGATPTAALGVVKK